MSETNAKATLLTQMFSDFFASEKLGGMLLILCTVVSIIVANSAIGGAYQAFWQQKLLGLSVEHWINDALMAVFFLLIGLELERELYVGELSNPKNALLPAIAALGGIVVPALIHFSLNFGAPTRAGAGIPMATDIAFALGVLAMLGNRVPGTLKVFLTALAVMDDLGAIIVIAVFYTGEVVWEYLLGAFGIFFGLLVANRFFRLTALLPYLLGGAVMWFLMLKSGVHATIAGVMLAFAIPFHSRDGATESPSHRLEHILHKPVAFLILPVFALANTAMVIGPGWADQLLTTNSLGIIAGLFLGKPLGVTLFCLSALALGVCRLPAEVRMFHIVGASLLAGIGFTMSIFITNLAFPHDPATVAASKMAVLIASVGAGIVGFIWLRFGKGARDDLN